MNTPKLNYETPGIQLVRFTLERNFCESNVDIEMGDTIFDELDIILPNIW